MTRQVATASSLVSTASRRDHGDSPWSGRCGRAGRFTAPPRRRGHLVLRGRRTAWFAWTSSAVTFLSRRSRRSCPGDHRGEDHRVYSHLGIDPIAWAARSIATCDFTNSRAAARSLKSSRARCSCSKQEDASCAQGEEAVLALCWSTSSSKDQILELYLTASICTAASTASKRLSRNLYGKQAHALTLPEAALIAD